MIRSETGEEKAATAQESRRGVQDGEANAREVKKTPDKIRQQTNQKNKRTDKSWCRTIKREIEQ